LHKQAANRQTQEKNTTATRDIKIGSRPTNTDDAELAGGDGGVAGAAAVVPPTPAVQVALAHTVTLVLALVATENDPQYWFCRVNVAIAGIVPDAEQAAVVYNDVHRAVVESFVT